MYISFDWKDRFWIGQQTHHAVHTYTHVYIRMYCMYSTYVAHQLTVDQKYTGVRSRGTRIGTKIMTSQSTPSSSGITPNRNTPAMIHFPPCRGKYSMTYVSSTYICTKVRIYIYTMYMPRRWCRKGILYMYPWVFPSQFPILQPTSRYTNSATLLYTCTHTVCMLLNMSSTGCRGLSAYC